MSDQTDAVTPVDEPVDPQTDEDAARAEAWAQRVGSGAGAARLTSDPLGREHEGDEQRAAAARYSSVWEPMAKEFVVEATVTPEQIAAEGERLLDGASEPVGRKGEALPPEAARGNRYVASRMGRGMRTPAPFEVGDVVVPRQEQFDGVRWDELPSGEVEEIHFTDDERHPWSIKVGEVQSYADRYQRAMTPLDEAEREQAEHEDAARTEAWAQSLLDERPSVALVSDEVLADYLQRSYEWWEAKQAEQQAALPVDVPQTAVNPEAGITVAYDRSQYAMERAIDRLQGASYDLGDTARQRIETLENQKTSLRMELERAIENAERWMSAFDRIANLNLETERERNALRATLEQVDSDRAEAVAEADNIEIWLNAASAQLARYKALFGPLPDGS